MLHVSANVAMFASSMNTECHIDEYKIGSVSYYRVAEI